MNTAELDAQSGTTEMVATVAAAFFQNNPVPIADIGTVIQSVRNGLAGADAAPAVMAPTTQEPKVPVNRSVRPDYIVCLEDGKKLKMLKRHLMASYRMTPEQYRQKWSLPADYPMVAPNYAAQRRELAMAAGLGRNKDDKPSGSATATAAAPAAAPSAKGASASGKAANGKAGTARTGTAKTAAAKTTSKATTAKAATSTSASKAGLADKGSAKPRRGRPAKAK